MVTYPGALLDGSNISLASKISKIDHLNLAKNTDRFVLVGFGERAIGAFDDDRPLSPVRAQHTSWKMHVVVPGHTLGVEVEEPAQ